MSLSIALGSAVSSLMVVEQEMAVASANIANATTTDYTEKTVDVAATEVAGTGTGITALDVSNTVDKYLLSQIVAANSQSGAATITSDYYDSLQQLFGEVSTSSTSTSGSDISSDLSTLSTDLTTLAASPDTSSDKTAVVEDLTQLADDLRSTSSGVQELRQQAEDQISTTVSDINTQLQTINTLNKSIVAGKAAGQSTADLEDQRTTALKSLSADMGVSYYVDGTGRMQIYSSSGQPMLVGDAVNTVSHTESSDITASTTYSGGGIGGITICGKDVTNSLGSGKLAALVAQRDSVLPGVQSELDSLASTLSSAFNTISNQGSASPPPQTLTGSTSVSGSDAVTVASGTTVRVAVTDSSGDIVSVADVSLDGDSTVDDIVSSLNTAFTSGSVAATASVDSSGHLVIQATSSSDGIAVSTTAGTVGGTDFSSYFGLNDVLVDGSSAATIRVKDSLTSSASTLPTGTLTGTAAGDTAVASGSSTIVSKLAAALTTSQSFAASGALGATTSTLGSYASAIISDVSTRYTSASSTSTTKSSTLSSLEDSFSNESGVNTDSETAKLTDLQDMYQASAQVVSAVKTMFQTLITVMESA